MVGAVRYQGVVHIHNSEELVKQYDGYSPFPGLHVNGKQTLYYRLALTKRYTGDQPKPKGPVFRDSIPLEGAEKVAADALLAPIREHSADVETFIGETIKRVNNLNDDNVLTLLNGEQMQSLESARPEIDQRADRFQRLCFQFGLRIFDALAENISEVIDGLERIEDGKPKGRRT